MGAMIDISINCRSILQSKMKHKNFRIRDDFPILLMGLCN